ncbi:hypothetical protein [Commensalibacter communis]|uniref:hypothetical protein n=1 Tax=Commensalibacter communis TaxID=2972786 RepID=UPI0023300F92|nr:hypothetical protein [Commensalibacter communis]
MPQTIGNVVCSHLATLKELQTTYGVKDLYCLLEINDINAYNEAVLQTHLNKEKHHG